MIFLNTLNKSQWFIGFLVVVIILYLFALYLNYRTCNELITGIWTAPPNFLEDAGLDSMILYIGEKKCYELYRPCYILIQRDNEIFLNEPTEMKINWNWTTPQNWNMFLNNNIVKCGNIHFKMPDDSFPNKQNISFNPVLGKIILSVGDTIYASLYRSAELSETTVKKQNKINPCD